MSVMRAVCKSAVRAIGAAVVVVVSSGSAFAQAADPNPGAVTLTTTFDVLNTYMFRGIRQNNTGAAMWPAADFGLAFYTGEGGVKSVGMNLGTWNSLHTGNTGQDSASGKLWYESDFYATFGLTFGGGFGLGTTYTAYTSPNNGFTSVREVMFKLGEDDTAILGKFAMKPYAIFAFEMATDEHEGQADGGLNAGKYLELGIAPSYAGSAAGISVPVKVGMSMGDYYEHPVTGEDNTFGFFSIAGIVTIPLGGQTKFGTFNIHGGAEFQALGDTTKYFATDSKGKEQSKIGIYSFGFGWSY